MSSRYQEWKFLETEVKLRPICCTRTVIEKIPFITAGEIENYLLAIPEIKSVSVKNTHFSVLQIVCLRHPDKAIYLLSEAGQDEIRLKVKSNMYYASDSEAQGSEMTRMEEGWYVKTSAELSKLLTTFFPGRQDLEEICQAYFQDETNKYPEIFSQPFQRRRRRRTILVELRNSQRLAYNWIIDHCQAPGKEDLFQFEFEQLHPDKSNAVTNVAMLNRVSQAIGQLFERKGVPLAADSKTKYSWIFE